MAHPQMNMPSSMGCFVHGFAAVKLSSSSFSVYATHPVGPSIFFLVFSSGGLLDSADNKRKVIGHFRRAEPSPFGMGVVFQEREWIFLLLKVF